VAATLGGIVAREITVVVTLRVTARIPLDDEAAMERLRELQACVLPDSSGKPPWLLVTATRESDKKDLTLRTAGVVERLETQYRRNHGEKEGEEVPA
jgi:hypothetical protein